MARTRDGFNHLLTKAIESVRLGARVALLIGWVWLRVSEYRADELGALKLERWVGFICAVAEGLGPNAEY